MTPTSRPTLGLPVDDLGWRDVVAHRDLRLHLAHHAAAGLAKSMGSVALATAIYRQTESAAWVGAAMVAGLLPYLVGSSAAGVVADRVERRRLLIWTTLAPGALMTCLAIAIGNGGSPWLTVSLVAVITSLGTAGFPAVVADLPRVVGHQRVGSALDAATSIECVAWTLGPAIGGLLLVIGPPELVLAVVVWLFVVSAVALMWVSPEGADGSALKEGDAEPFLRSLAEGARAIVASPDVVVPLLLLVAVHVVLGGASVGLVLVADELLGVGDAGFGLLNGALGLGLVSVVFTHRLASTERPFPRLAIATLLSGIPFALLSVTRDLRVALVLVACAGAGSVVTEVVALSVIVQSLPSAVTARVVGFADAFLLGALLLGSVIAPLLIGSIGLRASLLVVGGVCPVLAVAVGHRWIRSEGPTHSPAYQS